jgi:RES domain-containing protein
MPARIPTVPVTGTWYRHVPADAPPMPGHPAPSGRWQRGEQLPGLYLAEDPATVWAEWYRALAELGEPPDARLPRDLWQFSVRLERVADLSQPRALRALGIPQPRPDRTQWPAFQDAGLRLAEDRFEAVLFRSSARPSGRCVCVFATAAGFPGVRTTGAPERIDRAPAPPRGMRT